MELLYAAQEFALPSSPLSLTIGNFDGVHRGHQAIFSHLQGHKVVVTFTNHTRDILHKHGCPRITSPPHRLRLFEEAGIDTLLMLPFTDAFAAQSAEAFLTSLHKHIPFTNCVLGYDASLGRGREGDRATLKALAKKGGFSVHYVAPIEEGGIPISSRRIRGAIGEGRLEEARLLLGRPYSILSPVAYGVQQGRILGFPTANFALDNLCLPPLGVYLVEAMVEKKSYCGVANVGQAPTLHADRPPLLEVHLLDYEGDLYQKLVEITFLHFLRPERRFSSIEALQAQIREDIVHARRLIDVSHNSISCP